MEITIEDFKNNYWEEEFNNLFRYIYKIKEISSDSRRTIKDISTNIWINDNIFLGTSDNMIILLWIKVHYIKLIK